MRFPLSRIPLVAAVLGIGLTLAVGPASTSSPAAAASGVTTRVLTYNIMAGKSTSEMSAGVHGVLGSADLVGLQEINSKAKGAVLQDLPGWGVWRQSRRVAPVDTVGGAEQTPVLWRTSRFSFVSARPVLLTRASEQRTHGEVPGYHEDIPTWVSVVHLMDRSTHRKISVVNVHLVQGAVMSGKPVRGRPLTWQLYTTQVHRVAQLAKSESAWGTVFTLGDFNSGWVQDNKIGTASMPVRQFRSVGMVSMWATKHPAKGKPGTHSTSLIDQVFAKQHATSTRILFSVKHSDHYPAVATYKLTKQG